MATETKIFETANDEIVDLIKRELRLQGHHAFGDLEESLDGQEIAEAGGVTLTAQALAYLEDLENFTPPEKINVSFDDYKKLKRWVILRGLASEDVRAGIVAQKIIEHWKRHGRPTEGSASFSQTGKRTDAVKDAINENETIWVGALDTAAIGSLDNNFSQVKSGVI